MIRLATTILLFLAAIVPAEACTSMIVSARASTSGRPLLWKHRDTGADNNFLQRVEAVDGHQGYVALFNAGDSLLAEAWMGMNDSGFAIMNTASYNLAPDTAKLKDCEALVMTKALQKCTTVDDFELLLSTLPKPMGVQTNFGVIDAHGGAAYFETDDWKWTRFDVDEQPEGVMIRTNHSMTGVEGEGSGYIRYVTTERLTRDAVRDRCVTPELLTEVLSRSFYHSLLDCDFLAEGKRYAVNQDFIPRDISTSSIVVEGVVEGQSPSEIRMWAVLGYPPCASVEHVTLTEIPDACLPHGPEMRSPACDEAMRLRETTFPFTGGSGKKYIDFDVLRLINDEMYRRSLEIYSRFK